ncbi:hypothetical protein [Nocardia sp. NPDC051750]|uniref:hypothetical protein n=1 Tax=Nocardia sp. NPDC051750 TaxID=3364325 RepID=UPI0037AC7350
MLTAVYLMLAGALVTLLGAALGFFDSETTGDDTILVNWVVTSIFQAGLWIWMALANQAGRNWARITGTAFFGTYALLSVIGLVLIAVFDIPVSVVGMVVSVVTLGIGLGAVIALWHPNSTRHFAPGPPADGRIYLLHPPQS